MRANEWWKKVKKTYKFAKIYLLYIVSLVLLFTAACLVNAYISSIDANFEEPTVVSSEESSIISGKVSYNYFLDFSPSMLGFLNEDIDPQMRKIAEIFEQLNAGNEDNNFYWCKDEIERVTGASVFYDSMKTSQVLYEDWYEKVWDNTSGEESFSEIEEIEAGTTELNGLKNAIEKIDLSEIFSSGFTRTGSDEAGSLNVIVTDLNFMKSTKDEETHDTLLDRLARYLGGEAGNADVCIYAVDSEFKGIAHDELNPEWNNENRVSAQFYMIIYSENTEAYQQYIQQLEAFMANNGLSYYRFEMLNNPGNAVQKLHTELVRYQNLGLIEQKERINFANGMFENLDGNEFAIQLVSGEGGNGTLTMPVSRIDLPGYYNADIVGLDETGIEMEVELYRPVNKLWPLRRQYRYELFDDPGFVLRQGAGLYYDMEQWLLRIDMALNTRPNIPQAESGYQRFLEKTGRKYFVMNLKFYLTKPSYSKPDWAEESAGLQTTGEGASNIAQVMDAVIRSKENGFASHSKEDRYMGNEVVYILYGEE